MSVLSWVLVIAGGICGVILFAWLVKLSLNQGGKE